MATAPRLQVVMKLPRRTFAYIGAAGAIIEAMRKEPRFAHLRDLVEEAWASIQLLEAAETHKSSGLRGSAAARDVKLSDVHNRMEALRSRVEEWANDNTEDAAAGVAAAGMHLKRRKSKTKKILGAAQGRISGQVVLSAKMVAKEASYEWQYSVDGEDWVTYKHTLQARVVIDKLEPERPYWFRFRATTSKGVGDWIGPIRFLVS